MADVARGTSDPEPSADTVPGVAGDVFLYDGDCAFCSSSVRVLRRLVGRLPDVVAYQFADLALLGVTADECAEAVQWIGADGGRSSGHLAIAQMLAGAGRGWPLVGRLLRAPVVSPIAGMVYRWVSRNRHRLPGGTPACSLGPDGRRR